MLLGNYSYLLGQECKAELTALMRREDQTLEPLSKLQSAEYKRHQRVNACNALTSSDAQGRR